VISSFNPFLENPINPPSIESHNCILENFMANLGGGRDGGNQPSPPPLNPWIMGIFLHMSMNSLKIILSFYPSTMVNHIYLLNNT
jgi:hypothetical protein